MDKSAALALIEKEAKEIERLSHLLLEKLGPNVTDNKGRHFLLSGCVGLGKAAKEINDIVNTLRGEL